MTDIQAAILDRLDAAVALGVVALALVVLLLAIIAVKALQS